MPTDPSPQPLSPGGERGRAARFDRLFGAHRRAVHAVHFASAHDADAAADGVQETFLRVWRRLDAVPPDGERAYVLRAARTVAVDAARRRAARLPTGSETERADTGPSPHDRAATGIDLDRLDAAIRALPDDLRAPLVMSVLGGMEGGEIAEALGKPPGTVRYLIHQARARLEEAMR